MTRLCHFLRLVIGALIAALVLSVAVGVLFRYALQQSLFWATEVPNILMIWIVFLGSVVALHEKKHIAFAAILDALGPHAKPWAEALVNVIILLFLLALVGYGSQVVGHTMDSRTEALQIPQGYLYACLPVSSGLMAISTLQGLWGNLKDILGRGRQ